MSLADRDEVTWLTETHLTRFAVSAGAAGIPTHSKGGVCREAAMESNFSKGDARLGEVCNPLFFLFLTTSKPNIPSRQHCFLEVVVLEISL